MLFTVRRAAAEDEPAANRAAGARARRDAVPSVTLAAGPLDCPADARRTLGRHRPRVLEPPVERHG
jgi:hypothetical protein